MPAAPGRGSDVARGGATSVPPGGTPAGRRVPLRGLTVLYDPGCRLCGHVARWLAGQRKLIPLRLVPVGSDQARRLFPDLDHEGATRREITVVGDAGQVYVGQNAWVVVLWALADHRTLAHSMSTPAGRRLARAAVLGVARYREARGGVPAPPSHPRPARTPGHGAPLAGKRGRSGAPSAAWVHNGRDGWVAPGCTDGCPPPG